MSQGNGQPASGGAFTLSSILNCFACGGQHEQIECAAFKQPNPPYTHWFMCPTAQEPVGIGLMMQPKPSDEVIEIHHRALTDLAQAMKHPHLIGIATMVDDRITATQHSFFPADKRIVAADKIREAVYNSLPKPTQNEPLPKASPETLKLFGRNNPAIHAAVIDAICPLVVPPESGKNSQSDNSQDNK